MSRVEQIGDATLYLGDCRDLAGEIVADAVISDPPYGIGYVHSGRHGATGVGATKQAALRGNPPIVGDKPQGQRWLKKNSIRDREWGGQATFQGDNGLFDPGLWLRFRNVLVWGADHYRDRLPSSGRWLAWDKLGRSHPGGDSFSDVEFAWHSRGGASRIFSLMWKGIACEKRDGDTGVRDHPTQKPIALMLWCIQQAGMPDRILDPFMGSGTTGVAALRLGRKFIGIEIEPRWFDVACRRIEAEARQGRLPIESTTRAAQDQAELWTS